MPIRNMVEINEQLCDGCGQCVSKCAEGALRIVDGKAKLIEDSYCDGLGACIGLCPRDAITITQREADSFSEEAAKARMEDDEASDKRDSASTAPRQCGWSLSTGYSEKSALSHWPVQLRLVPVKAPFFAGANLLLVADCVPFAYAGLHRNLLPSRCVVVGCPKFNDAEGYAQKLAEILRSNDVRSIALVNMEVPCCFGLGWIAKRAIEMSAKSLPLQRCVVTVKGELKEVTN